MGFKAHLTGGIRFFMHFSLFFSAERFSYFGNIFNFLNICKLCSSKNCWLFYKCIAEDGGKQPKDLVANINSWCHTEHNGRWLCYGSKEPKSIYRSPSGGDTLFLFGLFFSLFPFRLFWSPPFDIRRKSAFSLNLDLVWKGSPHLVWNLIVNFWFENFDLNI